MRALRRAEVTWEGNLIRGKGVVGAATSKAFTDLPVTWASRSERADGRTSPEELVAAAHASCYAMAFSHGLNQGGATPKKLEVTAMVVFSDASGGPKVVSSALTVKGWVDGIDAAGFAEAAEAAKDGCPISQALKGNVELSVEATLAS